MRFNRPADALVAGSPDAVLYSARYYFHSALPLQVSQRSYREPLRGYSRISSFAHAGIPEKLTMIAAIWRDLPARYRTKRIFFGELRQEPHSSAGNLHPMQLGA